MIAVESLRIALQGVLSNRLRSLLTMLGVTIGVASVIVLVAVGTGSSAAVQKQLEGLGTNVLTVFPSRGGFGAFGGGRATTGTQSRAAELTMKDVAALQKKQNAPSLKSVNPVVSTQVTATYQGATYQPGQFTGTTAGYFEAENFHITAGRLFTAADVNNHAPVVVLGQTVVQNLFGATNPIGQTIAINGVQFQVIGVLESKGN